MNNIERKWLILMAVGVGTFMSALDGSVVNTVLPVIRQGLDSPVVTIQWVVTIYLLVVSGLLLSVGRLGDMRGHRLLYVAGFVVFLVGSALCGLAPSAMALIAFRALQAVGAAMLMANSPAILTRHFPPTQRGQALGLQATMTYLGLTVGPSLGGWLATLVGWRFIFYINVPVGALALFLSIRFIPLDAAADHGGPFDVMGALTFMAGLVALLSGLNRGAAWGWSSPAVLTLLGLAVILLVAFWLIERRSPHPMLDLGLFRNRLFSAATASALMNYICLYGVTFLLPFYLIQGRGLQAAQAGLILTAQPLVMAITAPVSGTLSDRIGSRLPGTLGMALVAAGLVLLSRLGAHSPLAHVAMALMVTGAGTGIFISPNTSALMGAAPRHRQGIAAGILATARNVGMVLGVGLAGAIFSSVMVHSPYTLFDGVSVSLRVAAGIAVGGAVVSAVRGNGGGDREGR